MVSRPTQPHVPQPAVDPDDRTWRANAALLLLAAIAAGLLTLLSDFNDTRVLHNGWTHLVGLVLTTAVLMWGVTKLRGRMRQRLQVAVLVSLFIHLSLGYCMQTTTSRLEAERSDTAGEAPPEDEAVKLTEYAQPSPAENATTEMFEAPVEVATPDAQRAQVEQQAVEAPPSVADRPSMVDEPTSTAPDVAAVELQRAEPVVPRRGNDAAGAVVERQPLQMPDDPQEIIPLPAAAAEAAQSPSADATASLPRRQEAAVPVDAQAGAPSAPGGSPALEPLAMNRRQAERTLDVQPGQAAAIGRQTATPAEPRLESLGAPQISESGPQGSPSLQPAEIAVDKIAGDGPGAPGTPGINGTGGGIPDGIELPRVASTATRRSGAADQAAAGFESGPGVPSRIPRSIAGVNVPTATATVEPVEIANVGGSGQAGQLEASPGVGVGRAEAQAPLGSGFAAAGTGQMGAGSGQFGTGSGRVGGNLGPRRAGGGGGEPAISGRTGVGTIGRANIGGAAIPSGMAEDVGPVPLAVSTGPGTGTGLGGGTGPGGGVSGTTAGAGAGGSSSGLPGAGQGGQGGRVGGGGTALSGGGLGGNGVGGPGGSGPSGSQSGQGAGGAPVRVAAIPTPGRGGTGVDPTAQPGVVSRRARPESDVLDPQAGRFILPRSGSSVAVDGRVNEQPSAAFNQRNPGQRQQAAASGGGTAGSEHSVELGLDFLVRHQSSSGNWSLHAFGAGRPGYVNVGYGRMQADTAATGLALLGFLGAGYTHIDGKHNPVVRRGLDYLVRNQKPDGDLFTGGSRYAWLYSHGIASIALCEAYGMTKDPGLRAPAQRAIDFIVNAQSPTEGGWRYVPRQGTDTSVSGWQLMALKSGEMAGLKIPATTYEGVSRWLDVAQGTGNGSFYAYRPASDQPHQRDPTAAMTAEGLLMRLYLTGQPSTPMIQEGAQFLRLRLPQFGTESRPQRDTYYWYYATQTLFQVQGDAWTAWNEQLRNLLVGSQVQTGALAGSWDPLLPVPDRWGLDGGRIYVTAMHLLNLEVYYRHLPLYRQVDGVAARP